MKITIRPNINDVPIAPTSTNAGNASHLIEKYNDLYDEHELLRSDLDLVKARLEAIKPPPYVGIRGLFMDFEDMSEIGGHTYTLEGSAEISSDNAKSGSSSLYIPDETSYIEITPNPSNNLNIKDGDFTIEFWRYSTAYSQYVRLLQWNDSNSGLRMTGDSFRLTTERKSTYSFDWSVFDNVNVWAHYAFTRQDTTVRSFINGVLRSTGTVNASMKLVSRPDKIKIGRAYGYFDDIRILHTCKYTGAFTPS